MPSTMRLLLAYPFGYIGSNPVDLHAIRHIHVDLCGHIEPMEPGVPQPLPRHVPSCMADRLIECGLPVLRRAWLRFSVAAAMSDVRNRCPHADATHRHAMPHAREA